MSDNVLDEVEHPCASFGVCKIFQKLSILLILAKPLVLVDGKNATAMVNLLQQLQSCHCVENNEFVMLIYHHSVSAFFSLPSMVSWSL